MPQIQLLQMVTPSCLKLDVGTRWATQYPQAEINQLLVEYCLKGKQVVRLKSGDPFICRSTSEIEAVAAGCPFEVVLGFHRH